MEWLEFFDWFFDGFDAAAYSRSMLAFLRWLGGKGTRAVAVVILLGIAVPPLGAVLQPFVGVVVFFLLAVSFLRVDPAALLRHFRRPGLFVSATIWSAIAVPFLFGGIGTATGVREGVPDLFLGIVLQATSAPMMAAPAIALLMGLDATLVLLALVFDV